jgi:uncharacterized protein (DUF2336 family)
VTLPANSRFALLLDLATEGSGERRRELLLQLTNIFMDTGPQRTEQEGALFDDIFAVVAADLETSVKAELAHKIAFSGPPLGRIARRLAMEPIAIARPVVEHSRLLLDSDLLEVVRDKGGDHHLAVARRRDLGPIVSDALVDTGSDRVLSTLLENETARLTRATFEKVANRASANPRLHAPFVKNRNVPLDLLNAIYLEVAEELRGHILHRFQGVSVEELNAALEASRDKVAAAYGGMPTDFVEASEHVANLVRNERLLPPVLPGLLRDNKRTAFLIAFARLADVDFGLVQRLVQKRDVEGIALLCRSASFPRGLFVTIFIMLGEERSGLALAETYGELYERASVVTAQRAVRFWKLRSKEASRSIAA